MPNPFIKYEDCVVKLNEKTVFATDASLSVSANLAPSRDSYGRLLRYSPQGGVVGSLSLRFFPTKDFSTNYQEFDLIKIVEQPEHLDSFINGTTGSFAGVEFSNAYLKSFEFSIEPFSPISVNASFDIYGSLKASSNLVEGFDSSATTETGIANGVNSYFTAATSLGVDYPISFDYSAQVNMGVDYEVGSTIPTRVSRRSTNITMNVNGEGFGEELSFQGNDAALTTYLYPLYSTTSIGSFYCSGKVYDNKLSSSSNNYVKGSLGITQNLK